jgi:hypothetical protein
MPAGGVRVAETVGKEEDDRLTAMSWRQTPAGLRAVFWVALIFGVVFIGLFIYLLWEVGHFRPI